MSNPKKQQREPDELELESETVTDLEIKEQEAEQVRGGNCGTGPLCVLGKTLAN